MNGAEIRPMTSADIPAVAGLFAEKRRLYEQYSPVFWRPAADGYDKHRAFLELLVADPSVWTLVAGPLDAPTGALIAMPRGQGFLIDDWALADHQGWSTTGAALLDHFLRAAGPTAVTVVAAVADRAMVDLLSNEGFDLATEWWILPSDAPFDDALSPSDANAHGEALNEARLLAAPPVYDPGGMVAMTERWDGTLEGLADLHRRVVADAVLLIVPVSADDNERTSVVAALGGHVASGWYERRATA